MESVRTDAMAQQGGELASEQLVLKKWNYLRQEVSQLYSKITELELDQAEHNLVIEAIGPLDPSRRCFRMVGGVLVERTVAEVLPAVKRNQAGIKEVVERMTDNLAAKRVELAELEKKYNIQIRRGDQVSGKAPEQKKEAQPGNSQGVLVEGASKA